MAEQSIVLVREAGMGEASSVLGFAAFGIYGVISMADIPILDARVKRSMRLPTCGQYKLLARQTPESTALGR